VARGPGAVAPGYRGPGPDKNDSLDAARGRRIMVAAAARGAPGV